MGLQLSDLNAPVTKLINCLLAPDHFEYGEPEPEQSCIRCSACSDACPVNLIATATLFGMLAVKIIKNLKNTA